MGLNSGLVDEKAISRQVLRSWRDVVLYFFVAFILLAIMAFALSIFGLTRLLISVPIWLMIFSIIIFLLSPMIIRTLYNLQEAKRDEYPRFYHAMESMPAYKSLWLKPTLYIADMKVANAFAFGHTWLRGIAITPELYAILKDEAALKGVCGHELAHIRMRDIMFATAFSFFIGWLDKAAAFFLSVGGPVGVIFGGIFGGIFVLLGKIFQAGLSQSRELAADHLSVKYNGLTLESLNGMISALDQLENYTLEGAEEFQLTKDKKKSKKKDKGKNPDSTKGKRNRPKSLIDGLLLSHPDMSIRKAALTALKIS